MLQVLSPIMKIVEVPFVFVQRRFGASRVVWLFLLPNMLLFGTFAFAPIFLNFLYAFTSGEQILLGDRPYTGWTNFQSLARCEDYFDPQSCERDIFWRALFNTTWFVTLQVSFMVGFSLLTAVILNRDIRARGFFRSVFFFPVMLSPVVVALIWKWILLRNGVLNAMLESLGFESYSWLLDASWAFGWSVFLSVWAHMGFYTLILLAGLQAIPRDVYDAALMDRSTPIRTFRRITLPLLAPTMLVVLVLALIKGVQTFEEIYAFTGGGPGTATTLIIQFIYETGFAGQPRLFGLASAASILLAIILVALTALQFWANRRNIDG